MQEKRKTLLLLVTLIKNFSRQLTLQKILKNGDEKSCILVCVCVCVFLFVCVSAAEEATVKLG